VLVPLMRERQAVVRHLLLPERPGPLVAEHVLGTGHGTCHVDRWPRPRVLVAESGGNVALRGDPDALQAQDLGARVAGFVDAPAPFVPLLMTAFPDAREWPRVIFTIDDGEPHRSPVPRGITVRRLGPSDAEALARLGPETSWISATWDGPTVLAASGMGWGAFAGEQVAAVSCPFFIGQHYEDLGVVTEPAFRGRGLSPRCAAHVCQDVRRRGRTPTWTTSPDNTASLRVAAKLGATLDRRSRLFVVGVPVPQPGAGERRPRPSDATCAN
jgi:RimJ/RimL family protein N-acetyltransferase